MKVYYIIILAISIALGVTAFFDGFLVAIMVSAVIATPMYMLGNKIARDKGLDSNDPKIPGTDPTVRLRNYGMSSLPIIAALAGGLAF